MSQSLRTFLVGDKKYQFEIIDRYSRPGKKLICLTVRITHAPTAEQWRGHLDVAVIAEHGIDMLLSDWLALTFRHHDPSKLPDDFDIPQGVPQRVSMKHICAVRGTKFSPP